MTDDDPIRASENDLPKIEKTGSSTTPPTATQLIGSAKGVFSYLFDQIEKLGDAIKNQLGPEATVKVIFENTNIQDRSVSGVIVAVNPSSIAKREMRMPFIVQSGSICVQNVLLNRHGRTTTSGARFEAHEQERLAKVLSELLLKSLG